MGGLHGCRRMTHVCSSRTLRRWLGGADGSLSADSPETDDTALPPPLKKLKKYLNFTAFIQCLPNGKEFA